MLNSLRLMHLMCAKICHDLATPLGAISMGVEMLKDSRNPTGIEQTLEVLEYSVQSAVARLNLLRCLTGYADQDDKPTLFDIQEIFSNFLADHKVTITWPDEETAAQIKNGIEVRLLLALLMIAADSLLKGGELSIQRAYPAYGVSIAAKGTGVQLREELKEILDHNIDIQKVSSRTVLPYFAKMLADSLGGTKIQYHQPSPEMLIFEIIVD